MMGAVFFSAAIVAACFTGFVAGQISAHRGARVVDEQKALHARRVALLTTLALVAVTIKTGV